MLLRLSPLYAFITVFAGSLCPQVGHADVIVPIPSIRFLVNKCSLWRIDLTYTATAMPDSTLSALEGMTHWSYNDHYHADTGALDGVWDTSLALPAGDSRSKLNHINNQLFRTPTPTPGRTSIVSRITHDGKCATELGLRECVGIFVSTSAGRHKTPLQAPSTLPAGMCMDVIPAPTPATCAFTLPSATINLGTGDKGKRYGSTSIGVVCTGDVTYRISLNGSNSNTIQSTGITTEIFVDNQYLPVKINGKEGANYILLEISSNLYQAGSIRQTGTIRIDIP